jgi:gliding motility-associated peptidyl-prolyl isomerase
MKTLLKICCLLLLVSSCHQPEARRPVSRTSGSFIKESAERNKILNEKERLTIKSIMAADTSKTYIASENGFWYHYNIKVENDTITAKFGDVLNYEYNITNLNGTPIYTKEDLKPQRYAMDQQELFSGLREGLKLMKAGENMTFIFPSLKAYGYYGDTKKIGSNIPIICNVALQSITKSKTN